MPVEYEKFIAINEANDADKNAWTIAYTDDDKQSPYYVNVFTRKVSWEKPPEFSNNPDNYKTIAAAAVDKHKNTKPKDKISRIRKKRNYPFEREHEIDEYVNIFYFKIGKTIFSQFFFIA